MGSRSPRDRQCQKIIQVPCGQSPPPCLESIFFASSFGLEFRSVWSSKMHPKRITNHSKMKFGGSRMLLGEVVGSLWPPGLPRPSKELQNLVRCSPWPPPFGSQHLTFVYYFKCFFEVACFILFFHFFYCFLLVFVPPRCSDLL